LAELAGHVDVRERPLVRVSLADEDRSFLALVDTGFNGWLLMDSAGAASLNFTPSQFAVSAQLAEGGQRRFAIAHGEIIWLGRRQRIEVLVSTAERARAALPDEPVAILGTRLLSPHRLEIDFGRRLVNIEAH
jgi:predicted aspartyl protease